MTTDATVGGQAECRALTGLRGLAALLVMLHHFQLHLAPLLRVQDPALLLRSGYLGVDLFFVLSGFVMAMTYGTWFAARVGPVHYLRFLLRRVARVWPLHVVIVGVLLVSALPQVPSAHLVLSNVFMVQAWGRSAEVNPPAWSVSAEMLAYAVFPLLTALVLRGGRPGIVVGLACAAAALATCLWLSPPIGPGRRGLLDIYFNYSMLPDLRCLAGFIVGMVAWQLGGTAPVQRWTRLPAFGPAALLLLLVLLLLGVDDLVIYPLMPLVVLGLYHGAGPVHRLLGRAPVRTLGLISYAVYLIHYPLLFAFPFDVGPPAAMLTVFLLSTLALATVAHLLIELPGRRLVRHGGDAALAGVTQLARRMGLA